MKSIFVMTLTALFMMAQSYAAADVKNNENASPSFNTPKKRHSTRPSKPRSSCKSCSIPCETTCSHPLNDIGMEDGDEGIEDALTGFITPTRCNDPEFQNIEDSDDEDESLFDEEKDCHEDGGWQRGTLEDDDSKILRILKENAKILTDSPEVIAEFLRIDGEFSEVRAFLIKPPRKAFGEKVRKEIMDRFTKNDGHGGCYVYCGKCRRKIVLEDGREVGTSRRPHMDHFAGFSHTHVRHPNWAPYARHLILERFPDVLANTLTTKELKRLLLVHHHDMRFLRPTHGGCNVHRSHKTPIKRSWREVKELLTPGAEEHMKKRRRIFKTY